jgi:hypothetical protein
MNPAAALAGPRGEEDSGTVSIRRSFRRDVVVLFAAVLLAAWPAFAQDDSRGEFSAGWRYYHATISSVVTTFQVPDPNDYPQGWYADASVNVSPVFAIVGEAGGTYFKNELNTTSGSFSTSETTRVTFYTFMGGVRIRAPQIPWFVPFGQILFGGERDTSSNERTLTFQTGTPSRTVREGTTSNPVLGLDAGVTMGGRVGARVSAGYVRFFRNADADALRVNVGGVFRF